jgi:hypothetical protein
MTRIAWCASCDGPVDADEGGCIKCQHATNYTIRCECGNAKDRNADACARCIYLDGTRGKALVVAALRNHGRLPLAALAEAIGSSQRAVLCTVQIMMRDGRLRRYWSEEATETERGCKRGNGRWVYALDGRTEDGR